MRKLSAFLEKISTGWLTLLAIGIFVLFLIFVLPGEAENAAEIANGAGSPDMSFFYSPDDLLQMAEEYGPEGRQAYIHTRFTFDLVFPIVYGLLLVTSISWLSSRLFPAGSRGRLLNLVPVVGVMIDYLENTAASIVMGSYPEKLTGAAALASGATLVKWVFVYGSFFVLFTVGAGWLYKRIKK